MHLSEKKIDLLIETIRNRDILEMLDKYRNMIKDWAAYVSLKLNNDYIKCPITLYNEVTHAHDRLKLINEYQNQIETFAYLQTIIEEDLE